jgi:hypothetical protein
VRIGCAGSEQPERKPPERIHHDGTATDRDATADHDSDHYAGPDATADADRTRPLHVARAAR